MRWGGYRGGMVAKLLQVAGFLIVTYVAIESFFLAEVPNMTFEFGGVLVGGAVFVVGKMLEPSGDG